MKRGADVEIEFRGSSPLDWIVDGKRVKRIYRQEAVEAESAKVVDVLWIVTEDGQEYPMYQPIGM